MAAFIPDKICFTLVSLISCSYKRSTLYPGPVLPQGDGAPLIQPKNIIYQSEFLEYVEPSVCYLILDSSHVDVEQSLLDPRDGQLEILIVALSTSNKNKVQAWCCKLIFIGNLLFNASSLVG